MSNTSSTPNEFKPGDAVVLRSGGPLMTVLPKQEGDGCKEGEVGVIWFGDIKFPHTGVFPASALVEMTIAGAAKKDSDEDGAAKKDSDEDGAEQYTTEWEEAEFYAPITE